MTIPRNLSVLAQGAGSNQTLTLTNTSANALAIGRQGTTNPVLNVDASTASVVTGLNVKGAAAAAGLALSVTSSGTNENLTIDAKGSGTVTVNATGTGNVAVNRLLDISAATAGQIQFPATQNASSDANVLDDWEEGTWSPALKFGGASVGMTYSGQTGFYQKMGKLVVCWLEIQLSAKGSSTGSATLTGFPFTAANNGDYPAFNSTANSVTGDILKGYLTPNTAIADLTSNVANSTAATDTIFSNTTKLQIQVIYSATA